MALMFWAPLPLKFTVLGAEELTSRIPEVMVRALAIPNVELADNCKEVPLMVVLKRLAVPLKVAAPVNVAVPAVADKLPLTERLEEIVKLAVEVMVPAIESMPKLMVPAPEIVFEVPLMVVAPVVVVKLPLTDKLPVITTASVVLTVPLIVRLSGEIPVPLMVLPVPVIRTVPPESWLKDPEPIVVRFPVKLILPSEKLINEAAIVRLLKFWVPDPLTVLPGPVNVMVPVLPLNVPLFTQFPPMLCVKLLPLNVVEALMDTFPLTVIVAAAVKETEVPAAKLLLRFPSTVNAVAGNVFTAAPPELLSVRFPYKRFATVWAVPAYSTVLATTNVLAVKLTG